MKADMTPSQKVQIQRISSQCKADMERAVALTSKDTNPKDAVGIKKARWFSFIPLQVLVGVGIAMLEGALKYGRHNYRIAGVRASVYVDACVNGHLAKWYEGGEDIDPDSGRHHLDKAIASLMVLRDGIYQGNWVDDRPPRAKDFSATMAQADADVAALLDKYPEGIRKAAFTELGEQAKRNAVSDPSIEGH